MDQQPYFPYDLIGIGIGPFNLGLAALAQPINTIHTLFFDKNEKFDWHPGLLLDDAHLQVPFLADLVTLADPTHSLSFLHYLQHHQRLYKFYFRENFHISRQEYNHYCQWVCSQLHNLHFNHYVKKVERYEKDTLLKVTVCDAVKNKDAYFYTKHLAVGIGTEPYIPEKLREIKSPHIHHSANFLRYRTQLHTADSICVVGSGQSAAEIVLTLLNEFDRYPRQLTWITRSRGFFPMEYSKLGLEHFSPDYTNYFYHLDKEVRTHTLQQQDLMYKGISQQTITAIFDKIYQLTIANKQQPITLLAHSELQSTQENKNNNEHRFTLHFEQMHNREIFNINCDAIILATGYRASRFDFLQSLADDLITDQHQPFALNNDTSIQTKRPSKNKIFVQNNSLFTHGVGSADLGLVCHRNSIILNQITKRECYPIHSQNVFQAFRLPTISQSNSHEYNYS